MTAAVGYACEPCGFDPARVWVQVTDDDAQPMCRTCAARAASDPVFLAGLAEAYREPVEADLPPLRAVEPVAPPKRQTGDGLAALVRSGHRIAAMRRRCDICDRVSNPGGLALHQKATDHSGWEAVS